MSGARQHSRFVSLLAVCALIVRLGHVALADDASAEAKAIREIERLGGKVERDGKLPARPVTAIRFKEVSEFEDEHIPLLTPFTKLTTLDLRNTKIVGTRIAGAGFVSLRVLKGKRKGKGREKVSGTNGTSAHSYWVYGEQPAARSFARATLRGSVSQSCGLGRRLIARGSTRSGRFPTR
jgi:hypothetical protein